MVRVPGGQAFILQMWWISLCKQATKKINRGADRPPGTNRREDSKKAHSMKKLRKGKKAHISFGEKERETQSEIEGTARQTLRSRGKKRPDRAKKLRRGRKQMKSLNSGEKLSPRWGS